MMSCFTRWVRSFILAFGVALPTMGCQVLFGDFKVGHGAHGGEGGTGASNGTAGGVSAYGGASGGSQTFGPIIVVPTFDLYTSDKGAQARFYVSLAQKPSHPVLIPIVSANIDEGTVSTGRLSFTTDDWNAPQVVIVTGVPDGTQDGNRLYAIEVGPAVSEDKAFQGAKAVVPITNIDSDSAGFFVTPTSGLVTTEAGADAVFTVVLNSLPANQVVLTFTTSDETIGNVAPKAMTFTPENWSAPQTVTVTAVNDDLASGDRSFQITVSPLASTDPMFANLPPQTVNVTSRDNDTAGVMVALRSGIDPSDMSRLRTSENENAESATFTVVLNNAPEKDVTIAVASNSGEGTVSPPSLTFTHLNWAAPQTVTVVGVDNDKVADGNQPYQVTLGPITSEDEAYRSLTSADLPKINAVNVDNDKADVAVTLLTNVDPNDVTRLQTSEKETSATFSIALTSKPDGPVQIDLNSTNAREGTVSPAQLDFTDDDWNVAQKVTVTGVDDSTKDGNVVYAVRLSAPTTNDPDYQKLPSTDVKVVNLDDDVAGITPPKLLSGIDAGTKLLTTESGGSASFSVSLTSKPNGEVRLPVSSSDTSEGVAMPALLTFTQLNYATAQVVTVVGAGDSGVDGNQVYTVTVGPSASSDTNYVGLSQSVKVTNKDEDSAYIEPTAYSGTTTEKGGSASFGIRLHSKPTTAVTVTFVSSIEREGKVSPASLSFTTTNWSTSQPVTVTGANDDIADGDQMYTIALKGVDTTDPDYRYAATTLTLVNKDDDVASLKVTAAANLQTTEAGGKATFTVALTSQPTGNVNVTISSNNGKEGIAAPASLTFTAANWATAQTVTVTGVDDSVADANQTYTLSLKTATSSADPKYAQLAASTVSLINTNDDTVGITVTPTSCATTPGTSATFNVVLKSQPLGPVSIALSSDAATTAGKVTPATLSFTVANWNTAQPVTVTGVDDGTTDTMTPYKIVTAAAVSALDTNYNGLNAADVACINTTPPPPPPPPPPPEP